MKRIWKTCSSKELFKTGIFRLRVDECELPDGRIMPRYYVFEFPDWVNIVPVTSDGKIVLVEQYRHATGEVTLEVPGGTTDPHIAEPAEDAAARELLEETGYAAERIEFVGRHRPNPATQTNFMHTFIAWNAKRIAEPTPDPFEDLEVVLKTPQEVYELIQRCELNHSIVMTSILLALPKINAVFR